MNYPLVSVIIPNYNHSKYLGERIESVLNQAYENFEVIILDDCSTDNSKSVIEKYRGHPKVSHIVYNEINSGSTFKQWKKGFGLAEGEYIWIAESDDIAHRDFLLKLITAIGEDVMVTLAASAITLIDEGGEIIGYASISKLKHVKRYSGKSFIRQNMLLGNHLFNASSAIFRKDALKNIDEKYTTLRASGDYLFWIELACQGNMVEIPDRLDYFRRSSTTVTPRLYASGVAFEEARIIFSRLQELGFVNLYYKHVIVGFRLWQITRVATFNTEEIRQHCLDIWKKDSKYPAFDMFLCFVHGVFRRINRTICNLL